MTEQSLASRQVEVLAALMVLKRQARRCCSFESSRTTLLTAVPIAGLIDGVAYEAAWTNGDGACGLHALFGDCNHGELVAPLCRAFVCEAFILVTPSGRTISCRALQQLWEDAMKVAFEKVKGGAVRNEQQSLWAALPQDSQDEWMLSASSGRSS